MENEEKIDLEEVNENGTSEEVVETENQDTKLYSEAELNQRLEEQREKINQDNQRAWNNRWGYEKGNMEKKFEKETELTNLLMEQTKAKDIDELLKMSYEQYDIEKPINQRTQEEEEILGKYDAKSILELDDDLIEEEANRLAGQKRNAREEATFMELGKYLTDKKEKARRKKEIEESGIEEEVYNQEDFQAFLKKFNKDTSLSEIADLYSKSKSTTEDVEEKTKPFSGGSLKDNKKKSESKYFTKEEFDALTPKDLDDPLIYEKAMRSRLRF